jgi:hypothetical protein
MQSDQLKKIGAEAMLRGADVGRRAKNEVEGSLRVLDENGSIVQLITGRIRLVRLYLLKSP